MEGIEWVSKAKGRGGPRKGKPVIRVSERYIAMSMAGHVLLGSPAFIAFGIAPNGPDAASVYVEARDGSEPLEDRRSQKNGSTRVRMDHALSPGTYPLVKVGPVTVKAEVPYRVFTGDKPKLF